MDNLTHQDLSGPKDLVTWTPLSATTEHTVEEWITVAITNLN